MGEYEKHTNKKRIESEQDTTKTIYEPDINVPNYLQNGIPISWSVDKSILIESKEKELKIFEAKGTSITYVCEFSLKTKFKEKNRKLVKIITYKEVFRELGHVKLIETEAELDDYYNSSLNINDWCRLKLVKKMKEIGLDDGFIYEFGDMIGNDIDKYKSLTNIAKECRNIDLLKYMLIYKYGKKK